MAEKKGATAESVAEYAIKHGVSEDVVRDIAGLDAPEPVEVTADADGHVAKLKVTGFKGDLIVDFGDGVFQIVTPDKGGKFEHAYALAGAHRIRVDAGGTIRWVDVHTQVSAPVEEEPVEAPVEDAPAEEPAAEVAPSEDAPSE